MNVLPVGENRMIVASFVSTKHRNVTDGQTDRQTDGSDHGIYSAIPTRCKNAVQMELKQCLIINYEPTLSYWHATQWQIYLANTDIKLIMCILPMKWEAFCKSSKSAGLPGVNLHRWPHHRGKIWQAPPQLQMWKLALKWNCPEQKSTPKLRSAKMC